MRKRSILYIRRFLVLALAVLVVSSATVSAAETGGSQETQQMPDTGNGTESGNGQGEEEKQGDSSNPGDAQTPDTGSGETDPNAGGQQTEADPNAGGQQTETDPNAGGQQTETDPNAGGQQTETDPNAGSGETDPGTGGQQTESESNPQTEGESGQQTEDESGQQTESESNPQTESESNPQTESESNPQTESESNPQTETEDRGTQCGANVWGKLSADGVLTVEGTGAMYDYVVDGQSVFNGIKDSVRKIVIGDGITKIGDYMFVNTACSEVVIGSTVAEIGQRAFYGARNLRQITIPGNVARISPGAFRASGLTSVSFSVGLLRIGRLSFADTPLTSIALPEGLREIMEYAFQGTGITSVTIPASVELIKAEAFGPGSVNAVIWAQNTQFEDNQTHKAFAAGSTITARRNSTAEAYANTHGLTLSYFCEPSGGDPSPTHVWDAGTVTRESTCAVQGEKTFTCTRCGLTRQESLAFKEHTYGSWRIVAAPTVFRKGLQSRVCMVCGHIQTEEFEKLKPVLVMKTSQISLSVGETYKLKVLSKSAGDSVASWKSTDKTVATVNANGKVTAKGAGTAKIKVVMESGISAKVQVTVAKVPTTKLTVSATGAKLKGKKVSVKANKAFTLVPKVKPANASDKITYSSSNKSIATVTSAGKVTARKKGKAKITVQSGKKKVTITVKVK